MSGEGLTIGRLAREAGVNVETVRYYQRRGLLPEPPRPAGGIRRYPHATVARIRFIKRAQRLGFTLTEIGELLSLGDGHCDEVQALARRKCAAIEARIRDLETMAVALRALLSQCEGGMPSPVVPWWSASPPWKTIQVPELASCSTRSSSSTIRCEITPTC